MSVLLLVLSSSSMASNPVKSGAGPPKGSQRVWKIYTDSACAAIHPSWLLRFTLETLQTDLLSYFAFFNEKSLGRNSAKVFNFSFLCAFSWIMGWFTKVAVWMFANQDFFLLQLILIFSQICAKRLFWYTLFFGTVCPKPIAKID